jgi:tRNA-dihydrouridine synthase
MRLGWDEASLSAPFFAREFEQAGIAAITIHGRTRAQGFGGTVNLQGIRAVVAAVERIPIVGNGDIRTIADAARMLMQTHCAAVAIGRGALLNPWIFAQLRRWEETGHPGAAAGYPQHLGFLDRHFHLLVADRGERLGCLLFRKMANWYCRVLHPGRDIQQRLVRIACVADFAEIMIQLRNRAGPWTRQETDSEEVGIAVPCGPVERW